MDGIIFDVDGTLWDTTELCARSWNAAIRACSGREAGLTGKMLEGLFGKPMDVIFRAVLPDADDALRERLIAACCESELNTLKTERVPTYSGVPETLRLLAGSYPLFIVSNCQKGYIEAFLENTGLGPLITDYLCYGDTLAPKSETLRRLVLKNGLKAPVYVGDTEGDAAACREAGVPFVFVSYGFGRVESPWRSVGSFPELSELLLKDN